MLEAANLLGGGLASILNPNNLITKALSMTGLEPCLNTFFSAKKLFDNVMMIDNSKVKNINIKDVTLQTSTYGKIIPEVFGNMRIAGNIIWSSNITDTTIQYGMSFSKSGVTAPYTKEEIRVNFAVAICKGIVDGINAIYVDNQPLNYNDYSFTIYYGTETQNPDSTMQSFLGVNNTPAFRGLCYIVFTNFPLENFSGRLPNLTFDITRKNDLLAAVQNTVTRAEDLIECIHMIPGSGEFVYDTVTQKKLNGIWTTAGFIQTSKSTILNNMTGTPDTNAIDSLNQLLSICKNLKWISLVVSWFGNNLDANYCSIYPACEYINSQTQPDDWQVGSNIKMPEFCVEIGRDRNGNLRYGGTPADISIVRFVQAIKAKGLKVMIYPMLMMDIDMKPWRGRMTTSNLSNISDFFNRPNGYNNFILHYAHLLNGMIDAIAIGSEMVGLTAMKDSNNNFPAVQQFCNLAQNVKNILGNNVIVTYAADWTEYHHTNGGYHNLDQLWAHPAIDVIGIDAYFPLSLSTTSIYDIATIQHGWVSGEGYDYYYSDGQKTQKNPLSPDWAWKNIEHFWASTHYDPNGQPTAWRPKMKKIWFTEYGFPSVDCCTNQPNVFYSSNSSESALPMLSQGLIDFKAQNSAIIATELQWARSECVFNKFLYTWDARPYPIFPSYNSFWADSSDWGYGHFVTGKIGSSNLSDIVANLCLNAGLTNNDFDSTLLSSEAISGYVIDSKSSPLDHLKILSQIAFFDAYIDNGKIVFQLLNNANFITIDNNDIILSTQDKVPYLTTETSSQTLLPSRIEFAFINLQKNYTISTIIVQNIAIKNDIAKTISTPVPMLLSEAQNTANNLLNSIINGNKTITIRLPVKYISLNPLDVIEIIIDKISHKFRIDAINFIDITTLEVKGISITPNSNAIANIISNTTSVDIITSAISTTNYHLIDVPDFTLSINQNTFSLYLATWSSDQNWKGANVLFSYDQDSYQPIAQITKQSIVGSLLQPLPASNALTLDTVNKIVVYLDNENNQLNSISDLRLYQQNQNLIMINNEIIAFQNITRTGDNIFTLSNLLRGRYKTESNVIGHNAGDKAIIVDSGLYTINLPISFYQQSIYLKVVSFDQNNLNINPQEITLTTKSLSEIRPFNILLQQNNTGNINITWFDAKFNNTYYSGNSITYKISIFDSNHLLKRTDQSNSLAYQYTVAMQQQDFTKIILPQDIQVAVETIVPTV